MPLAVSPRALLSILACPCLEFTLRCPLHSSSTPPKSAPSPLAPSLSLTHFSSINLISSRSPKTSHARSPLSQSPFSTSSRLTTLQARESQAFHSSPPKSVAEEGCQKECSISACTRALYASVRRRSVVRSVCGRRAVRARSWGESRGGSTSFLCCAGFLTRRGRDQAR